ncbi:MAG: hypothetical protein ABR905_07445 [Terracidiphilus sp.]|jgi:hypothetical protein
MRKAIVAALYFMCGLSTIVAFGQQLDDWHPERGVGAPLHWDDLRPVLIGSVLDYGDNYGVGNTPDVKGLAVHLEYEMTSPASCMLQERSFDYKNGISYSALESIDFRQVDPSSVAVQWNKDRSLYVVVFKSLPSKSLGDTAIYTRHGELPEAELFPIVSRSILSNIECATGESSCSKEVKAGEQNYELFVNVDVAHRFANASMQAALLCGGTK